jgi:membrane-associated PAP2 superfamily phosphatase
MTPRTRSFWIIHALIPAVAFTLVAAAGAFTALDIALARAWFFDAATVRFIGAGDGAWWARDLIHGIGGAAVRGIAVAGIVGWLIARRQPRFSQWRRAASYVMVSATVGLLLVGLLKNLSNVDCPRALTLFGGSRPYVHLFADRPDALPWARCFPGGHSASGFAWFTLYFALRERRRRWALATLGLAAGIGTLFAFGQEARGAHFLSHDVWSAALLWFTALGIYVWSYAGTLHADPGGTGASDGLKPTEGVPARRRSPSIARS